MLFWKTKNPAKTASQKEQTLCDTKDGESVRITCLKGEPATCHRLREMGFCESAQIEKVTGSKALICKVCDHQIVISEELAKNILVESVNQKGNRPMPKSNQKTILLSQLTIGQKGVIADFVEESELCERIEEMGVTPGEEVQIIRYAPLGDPIEIRIRGYLLSLRKEEANLIKVVPSNP